MERECSVDSSSLENGFHNEVVWSVYPERVVAEPLSENAVALLKVENFWSQFYLIEKSLPLIM